MQDAYAFAEVYFNTKDLTYLNSTLLTYKRDYAEIYEYAEDKYGYNIYLMPCYDGVQIGSYYADNPNESPACEDGYKRLSCVRTKCLMVRPDTIDWMWINALYYV